MLRAIAQTLDAWIFDQNAASREDGGPLIKPCTIRVVGQTALMEAQVPLTLAATRDVDVKADYEDAVRREFARLLAKVGRELDPLGHEIWMPRETKYTDLFRGKLVRLLLAEPDAVLVSKGLKAPTKNAPLIVEYLASGPSPRFLELATRYGLNLESFL